MTVARKKSVKTLPKSLSQKQKSRDARQGGTVQEIQGFQYPPAQTLYNPAAASTVASNSTATKKEKTDKVEKKTSQWRAKWMCWSLFFCSVGMVLVYASMGLPIISVTVGKKTVSLLPHTQINCEHFKTGSSLVDKGLCKIVNLLLDFNPITGILWIIHLLILVLGTIEAFHLLLRALYERENTGGCACLACCLKCAVCICTGPCKPFILLFFTAVGIGLCVLSAFAGWLDRGIASFIGNEDYFFGAVETKMGVASYTVPVAAVCFLLAVFLDVTELIASYAACLCSCLPCLFKAAKANAKRKRRKEGLLPTSVKQKPSVMNQQPSFQPPMQMINQLGAPFMQPMPFLAHGLLPPGMMPPPASQSQQSQTGSKKSSGCIKKGSKKGKK